jgi:hypothetical protein
MSAYAESMCVRARERSVSAMCVRRSGVREGVRCIVFPSLSQRTTYLFFILFHVRAQIIHSAMWWVGEG